MTDDRPFHPLDYLTVLRRRKWWFVAPLALSVAVGIVLALALPKTYVTSATIGIEAPKVLPDFVRGTSPLDRDERVRALTQQLVSRPVLARVAEAEGLGAGRSLDEAVNRLRQRIQVELPQSVLRSNTRSFDSFLLVYRDRDPERAWRVADRLAEVFVDENTRGREARAEGTAEFLATQLAASQERLSALEERLRRAKESHIGRLPEQTQANLQMVTGLSQQLDSTATALRGEQDRLSLLERQIEAVREGTDGGGVPTSPGSRVVALQHQLAQARRMYTEKHPEVQRLTAELAAAQADADAARDQPPASRNELLQADPVYRQLVADRDRVLLRIRDLERADQRTRQQIAQYQQRVEAAPMVEQQMIQLTREYGLEKDQYAQLAAKHQAALVAEDLERRHGGERFSILYPAYLPTRPESPDVPRLLAVVLGLGLALGAGLVVGREYLDRSVHDARALQDEFGLPVLGEVSRIDPAA